MSSCEKIRVWRPAALADIELRRGTAIREAYPRHWHEEYQFCLITAGDGGELTYRGSQHPTPKDSLFIVHPGEVHANRPWGDTGCSFRSVYLSPEIFQRVASELSGRAQGFPFFPQPMVFDQEILDRYRILHKALEESESRLAGESLLLELLVLLIARFAQGSVSRKAGGPERDSVSRVRDYLRESYAENVSLQQLARLAGLSPFHLSRVFTQAVGMPPHAYQTQVRIARAKTLIRQGYPISQVAALTGFADQSHFTRHFKRLMLLTPGQYLQNSKNVQDGASVSL